MHHIVAVEVRLASGEPRYFLTWGRIQDSVDPVPLASIVLRHAHVFAIEGEPRSARVLWALNPATDTPYFWDCFFDMCQQRIPFGRRYDRWRKKIAEKQEQGLEIRYCGHWFGDERDRQPDLPDATI